MRRVRSMLSAVVSFFAKSRMLAADFRDFTAGQHNHFLPTAATLVEGNCLLYLSY